MNIKIYDEKTYSDDLIMIRRGLVNLPNEEIKKLKSTDFVLSYLHDRVHRTGGIYNELALQIIETLSEQSIIVFHNTRILSNDRIKNYGLLIPKDNHFSNLKEDLLTCGIDVLLISELFQLMQKYLETQGEMRDQQICFYFDEHALCEYIKYSECFGGELVSRGIAIAKDPERFSSILDLGLPKIIELEIPFEWVFPKPVDKLDFARAVINYWVQIDLKDNETGFSFDAYVNRNIPPKMIRSVKNFDLSLCEYE